LERSESIIGRLVLASPVSVDAVPNAKDAPRAVKMGKSGFLARRQGADPVTIDWAGAKHRALADTAFFVFHQHRSILAGSSPVCKRPESLPHEFVTDHAFNAAE
jgi:hypothetical protein